MRTNSAYNVLGVDPVANPNIIFSLLLSFNLIKLAISFATYFDPSSTSVVMRHFIFSKLSIIFIDLFLLDLNLSFLILLMILYFFLFAYLFYECLIRSAASSFCIKYTYFYFSIIYNWLRV